jgi:hypothetical protein
VVIHFSVTERNFAGERGGRHVADNLLEGEHVPGGFKSKGCGKVKISYVKANNPAQSR